MRSIARLGFLLLLPAVAGAPVWTTHGPGPSPVRILSLAVDSSANRTIYAGTGSIVGPSQTSIFKSENSGTTWFRLFVASDFPGITALVVDPSDSQIVYAGTGFCHFRIGCHGGLLRSGDGGSTWISASTAGGYVTALALDPNPPNTLYAATVQSFPQGPGVSLPTFAGLQSSDGGQTWTNIASLPAVWTNQFLFDDAQPGLIFIASSDGVSKSMDGGLTWMPSKNGLQNLGVLAICRGKDSALYAATSGGVYKSSDQGDFWFRTTLAVPASAIVGSREGLFAASPGNGVYASIDDGATWTPTNQGLTDLSISALAIEPGGILHAGTASGVFDLSNRNLTRVLGNR